MDLAKLLQVLDFLWSPVAFAACAGLATCFIWLALSPARPKGEVRQRLDGYIETDVVQDAALSQAFWKRALWPAVRTVLRFAGRLAPKGSVDKMQQTLLQAGQPGGLTALDFFGLQLLLVLFFAAGCFLLFVRSATLLVAIRNVLIAAAVGYFLPVYWLRTRVRRRRNSIRRALPDALDMLSIGVEAGLAFESALFKVGDQWDNALTREFRRAVMEMRVGTGRDDALKRMAARCGVPDLNSFVAVLVQSNQLGVSIAQVLNSQAAAMRVKQQQRAEELARQAGVKMVFPLVFLVFPAILIVILGPSVQPLLSFFRSGLGGIGGGP